MRNEYIRQAKVLRESSGGLNHHQPQCDQIPDFIEHDKHGIHLTPCYKKFTVICSKSSKVRISLNKSVVSSSKVSRSESSQDMFDLRRSSTRLVSNSSHLSKVAWVYPNNKCNICGKQKVYDKKKKNMTGTLVTISTMNACNTVKMAAKEKSPTMYAEILLPKSISIIAFAIQPLHMAMLQSRQHPLK